MQYLATDATSFTGGIQIKSVVTWRRSKWSYKTGGWIRQMVFNAGFTDMVEQRLQLSIILAEHFSVVFTLYTSVLV